MRMGTQTLVLLSTSSVQWDVHSPKPGPFPCSQDQWPPGHYLLVHQTLSTYAKQLSGHEIKDADLIFLKYSWNQGSNRLKVNPNFSEWIVQSYLQNNLSSYNRKYNTIKLVLHVVKKITHLEPCEGCLCVIILHATPLSISLVLRSIDPQKLTFQTNLQFGKSIKQIAQVMQHYNSDFMIQAHNSKCLCTRHYHTSG